MIEICFLVWVFSLYVFVIGRVVRGYPFATACDCPHWFSGGLLGFREGAPPPGTPHRTFASHTHQATMAATVSALRVVAPVARVAARKATAARTALVVKAVSYTHLTLPTKA